MSVVIRIQALLFQSSFKKYITVIYSIGEMAYFKTYIIALFFFFAFISPFSSSSNWSIKDFFEKESYSLFKSHLLQVSLILSYITLLQVTELDTSQS